MARFTGGWIKIWRKTADSDLIGNQTLWALWHWLLVSATWRPSKILWNGKQRELQPGSVVFGLKELSDKWDCSKTTISKWLTYLHETGRIAYEPSTRGCIATICNWELYQSKDDDELTPCEHGEDTASTQRVHGVALSEEVKKERKEEGNTLTHENAMGCIQEWEKTLKHFEINRPIGPPDEIKIAKAIQRFGYEWVLLAFQGARKQTASKNWEPKNFVSLDIYLDPKRIERMVNIGAGTESSSDIDWTKVFGGAA